MTKNLMQRMRMMATSLLCLIVAWWMPCVVVAQNPAQPLQAPLIPVAIIENVGSLVSGGGLPLGSCFCIDGRGYVATTFSNVSSCADAYVLFGNGQKAKIAGVVAASRARDIAILEFIKTGKNFVIQIGPLDCNYDAPIQQGEGLVPWGGPESSAVAPEMPIPKVVRRLLGEEYGLGLEKLPASAIGIQVDNHWIWMDRTRDLSCNGGPVFNARGEVVAMQSNALHPGNPIFTAIHIKNVLDLVPKQPTKAKSLKSLKTWVDPLPNATLPVPVPTDDPSNDEDPSDEELQAQPRAGFLRRGLPLADRFIDLERRIRMVERDETQIAKSKLEKNAQLLEIAKEIQTIQDNLDGFAEEEPFLVDVVEKERRTRVETRSSVGADGRPQSVDAIIEYFVDVVVKRTRFRFSARQIAQMQPLRTKQASLRSTSESINNELAFNSEFREPFLTRLHRRLEQDYFYLADPLGLRSKEEIKSLEAYLTNTIEDGGGRASLHLARAMVRMRLRDLDGAEFDINESKEISSSAQPLARALEAQRLLLSGEKNKGSAAIKACLLENKSDPRILMIAARMEMDSKKWFDALRYLKEAAKVAPMESEIQQGIAWLTQVQPEFHSKQAIETASQWVRMSGGRDWHSFAALAAAYARSNQPKEAIKQMESALELAQGSERAHAEDWLSQLKLGENILPDGLAAK